MRIEDRERTEFIASLPLSASALAYADRGVCREPGPAEAASRHSRGVQQQAAFMVGAGLISFVADVDSTARTDVLNAILFAQLGADERFDRERDFANWHRFFLIVMGNVGWTVQALDGQPLAEPHYTVAELGLSLLAPHARGAELELAGSALAAGRRAMPVVFDDCSHSGEAGCFHLGTCTQRAQQVDTTLVSVHFQTQAPVGRLMEHVFDRRRTQLCASIHRCTLDLDAHAAVAQQLADRLAQCVAVFIHALEL